MVKAISSGKTFGDLMAGSGFASAREDNANRVRVIERDGLGDGYSSESSGSDRGPSCRFQDDAGTQQAGAVFVPNQDDVARNADTKRDLAPINPYTGLPTSAPTSSAGKPPLPNSRILESILHPNAQLR